MTKKCFFPAAEHDMITQQFVFYIYLKASNSLNYNRCPYCKKLAELLVAKNKQLLLIGHNVVSQLEQILLHHCHLANAVPLWRKV